MSMVEPTNRIGRFSIDNVIIAGHPEMAVLMLVGKLIVRAEARYEMATIEYHAYCDDFDEVGRGQLIPEYIGEFSQEEVLLNTPEYPASAGQTKIIQVFQRWVKKE